tara:strand:+ start:3793 stop:4014 length:222 start_codon:yes stop_codon:yes gene_type:complete
MNIYIKKIFFNSAINITLFLLLMIGIQNSSKSYSINLILSETIKLPTGFIVGISFISGSIAGSLMNIDFNIKK